MPQSKETPHARLRLSPARRLAAAGDEALLVLDENSAVFLDGAIYAKIGTFLPTCPDVETLCSRLALQFDPPEIEAAIQQLAGLGVFASQPSTGNPLVDAYWESAGVTLPDDARIRVVSLLPTGDAGVGRALEANGVHLAEDAPRTLVVTDDYLRPEIASIAASTSELLLARPVGRTIWMGPLVVEGETVCYACLAHWLRVNRWAQAAVCGSGLDTYPRQPALSALPSTLALGGSMVASVATLWSATGDWPELRGAIQSLETQTMRRDRHLVRPAPSCACLDRATTPSLIDFVSPICGIVPRLAVSESAYAGFHCARAQVLPPRPVDDARPFLRPVAVAGRGTGRAAAETSCLGEAIERYSAIFQGSEPRITAKLGDLGEHAVDPRRLFLFSERQLAHREEWNRSRPDLAAVPEAYDPAIAIEWSETSRMSGGKPRYVPSAFCYLWHASAAPTIYRADSNGCAAGPDRESAALSALLELIERDALSIWWDNRLVRPGWDAAALNRPEITTCRDALHRDGRQLHLLDITTDLEVPVCVAVAARKDGSEPYFAAAAALDPVEAAHRASGELAYLLWSGDNLAAGYLGWVRHTHVRDHPYLAPAHYGAPNPPPRVTRSEDSLSWCLERLNEAGLDTSFLDLTRPEIGVPVVRAIVPGLRHPWGRHAPGRLYDVPVRLGWSGSGCAEELLNPATCVL